VNSPSSAALTRLRVKSQRQSHSGHYAIRMTSDAGQAEDESRAYLRAHMPLAAQAIDEFNAAMEASARQFEEALAENDRAWRAKVGKSRAAKADCDVSPGTPVTTLAITHRPVTWLDVIDDPRRDIDRQIHEIFKPVPEPVYAGRSMPGAWRPPLQPEPCTSSPNTVYRAFEPRHRVARQSRPSFLRPVSAAAFAVAVAVVAGESQLSPHDQTVANELVGTLSLGLAFIGLLHRRMTR
jgi:hypothetical protein